MQTNPDAFERLSTQRNWINSRIVAMREAKGVTSSELARRMGVSPGRIYDIEHGSFELKVTTLLRVWEALGLTSREFFKGFPEID